jgi:transcriptional regulator with XRE-family HTH domain
MAAGDSPAGARRRLRLEIRKARETATLTQGQVAEALHWSISKVNRIETGENSISSTDLEALLRLLEVEDADRIELMRADARAARKRGRGWWDEPRFRDRMRPTTVQMLQFESEASAIRVFNYAVFPALLQIRQYAEATIGALEGDVAEDAISAIAESRMIRQHNFRNRPERPRYYVILDELLLQRIVGDETVMAEQLKAVAEAAREPNILIRLLPKDAWAHILIGSFVLFDFDHESAVLYRELSVTDEIIHAEELVARHRLRFERMWQLCLSGAATIGEIEARYATARASLLRHGGRTEHDDNEEMR